MRPVELASNDLGFVIVLAIVLVMCIVVIQSPLPKPLRVLIVVALVLRIVGAGSRFFVITVFYNGVGDAVGYYMKGVFFSPFFQNLDWSPITDPQYWWGQRWWGTTPMFWFSALVVSVIGQSMLGEFVVFSLLSFLGLVAFVIAFRRSFPQVAAHRYARWVWLFPSLWFWPSSVGKEAVVILGMGLAVMGIIGRRDKIQWLPFLFGVGIMFLIRPQFAALFLGAALIAYWIGRGRRWTPGKTLEAGVIAVAGIAIMMFGLNTAGVESFDLEGMQEFVETEGGRAIGGGSAIEATEIGPQGVPFAVINVLFRPFPWEADTMMTLASSLELVLLWILVLARRRALVRSLRGWRHNRLLRLSAAFTFVYTIALGMMVANLGIIARQRIFIFPFLFVFLEAVISTPILQRRPKPAMPVQRPPTGTGPGGAPWPEPTPSIPGRSSSR